MKAKTVHNLFPSQTTVLLHPDGGMSYDDHTDYPYLRGEVRPVDLLFFRLCGIDFRIEKTSNLKNPN